MLLKAGKIPLKKILFCIAILLIVSFAVHTIQFDHHHPGEGSDESVQRLLHGEDRKLWAFFSILFFVAALSLSLRSLMNSSIDSSILHICVLLSRALLLLFDPIRVALRQGIIHPKLYA